MKKKAQKIYNAILKEVAVLVCAHVNCGNARMLRIMCLGPSLRMYMYVVSTMYISHNNISYLSNRSKLVHKVYILYMYTCTLDVHTCSILDVINFM